MLNRDLHLIESKDGAVHAEFVKYPQYGHAHYVRRLLMPSEAIKAKAIIAKGDAFEIDSFCHSIA